MYFPTIFLGVNQNFQYHSSNHSKSTENLHQDNLCALLIMTNFLPLHSEQTIPLKDICQDLRPAGKNFLNLLQQLEQTIM